MLIMVSSYTGNGGASQAITGLGFSPLFVLVKGGANLAVARTSSMSGDKSKELAADTVLVTDRIKSLDSDGFTVGSNAQVNTNAINYEYWAFGANGAGDIQVGSYTGNGIDNTSISTSLTPQFMVIMGDTAQRAEWKYDRHDNSSQANGRSQTFNQQHHTNNIQRFLTNAFELGSAGAVNTNLSTYYFVVMRKLTGYFETALYAADGTDDRNITGAGFTPDTAFVQRIENSNAQMNFRGPSESGDVSRQIGASGTVSDRIQSIISDGIQVGGLNNVGGGGFGSYAVLWFKNQLNVPEFRQSLKGGWQDLVGGLTG